MTRLFLIMAIALLCGIPGVALAQNTTFYVSGSFTAPATGGISGSYVVDTGTNQIVSANIQVTGGKATNGESDIPANTFVFTGHQSISNLHVAKAVPAGGHRGGFLEISGGVATPSGAFSWLEGICTNQNCDTVISNADIRRFGTGIITTVPPVPSLSVWGMILFGMALAGGAALYIQRHRMTA